MSVLIKGNSVSKSGSRALRNETSHLNNNEEVPVFLDGEKDFFEMAKDAAKIRGVDTAYFHAQISFDKEPTQEEIMQVYADWKKEYDPKNEHDSILIQHKKSRADDKSSAYHFHAIMASVSTEGNILNLSHSHKRNEKIARISEVKLGHELMKGAHNKAVINALELNPETAHVAAKMKEEKLDEGPRPKAKYGSKMRMAAERLGVDLPKFAQFIKENENKPDFYQKLAQNMDRFNVDIKLGNKRNVAILTEKNGALIGNFNQLIGAKSADTGRILSALKEAKKADRKGPTSAAGIAGDDKPVFAKFDDKSASKGTREAALERAIETKGYTETGAKTGAKATNIATGIGGIDTQNQERYSSDIGDNDRRPGPSRRRERAGADSESVGSEHEGNKQIDGSDSDPILIEFGEDDGPDSGSKLANNGAADNSEKDRSRSVDGARQLLNDISFMAAYNRHATGIHSLNNEPIKEAPAGPKLQVPNGARNARRKPQQSMGGGSRLIMPSGVSSPAIVDITRMNAGDALAQINAANARSAGFSR